MKKYIIGIGILAGILLIVGGVAYGQDIKADIGQAINNYYGDTVVNQSVVPNEVGEANVGISDQSGGFVITKKITNSDIATTSRYIGVDLTNTAMGALIVDDIIVSTDTTGLSTTTPGSPLCSGITVTIEGNGASTTVMAINDLFSLQANETVDFKNASSSIKARLEEGSNLQLLPTTHPCMGSGVTTFTMFFKKVDERSFIYE